MSLSILVITNILLPLGICYWHFVILKSFAIFFLCLIMLYQEKSGNPEIVLYDTIFMDRIYPIFVVRHFQMSRDTIFTNISQIA
jgi:hypothetical protein